MHTWEYCKLTGVDAEHREASLCFYKASGPQTFSLKRDAWEQAIARLGREGWELVSVEGNTFFFKRPLSGAS
jgi:hypothetical protein